MPFHGLQLRQIEFEADDKHQKDHAKLGQMANTFRVLRQGQGIGANQHTHQQIAQHGGQFHQTTAHHTQHGGQKVQER